MNNAIPFYGNNSETVVQPVVTARPVVTLTAVPVNQEAAPTQAAPVQQAATNGTTWDSFIIQEKQKDYYKGLNDFLKAEYTNNECFPPKDLIFNSFRQTNINDVKVVILGQDPYHEPGQAMGLSFSVPQSIKLPPSLVNIFKEIGNEFGQEDYEKIRTNGDLTFWAKQGVLLLNSVLSVRSGEAGSHANHGWEEFTDNVIRKVNEMDKPIVFMLWGKYAKKKASLLNNPKHLVLETSHPSPFSARRGFFGCNHFKDCNSFLLNNGVTPINWLG